MRGLSHARLGPARYLLVPALAAVLLTSCGGTGGSSGSPGGGGDNGGGGDQSSGATSTSTEPSSTATRQSPADTTIVAYRIVKEHANDPHGLAVTFTNRDGDDETQQGVNLPWTGGSFVPVGAMVSLTAETSWVETTAFSCTVMLNGTSHVSASEYVTEGNDIVGMRCHVGPIVAEPFP